MKEKFFEWLSVKLDKGHNRLQDLLLQFRSEEAIRDERIRKSALRKAIIKFYNQTWMEELNAEKESGLSSETLKKIFKLGEPSVVALYKKIQKRDSMAAIKNIGFIKKGFEFADPALSEIASQYNKDAQIIYGNRTNREKRHPLDSSAPIDKSASRGSSEDIDGTVTFDIN